MRVIESLTIVLLPDGRRVRVWRQHSTIATADLDADTQSEIFARTHLDTQELLDQLGRLPRVNAVEITRKSGIGAVLLYPDWP